MKVQTEVTVEDFIVAHERAMARSRVARSWRYQGAATTAAISALFGGVFGFLVIGRTITAGLIGGAMTAVISAAISWMLYGNSVRKRLRKYYLEKFGDRDSLPYEVELSESGISTKQLGTHSVIEWANVEEVEETEDAVGFYVFGGGAVFLRKRAFASAEEQRRFIEAAQRYRNLSRTSSNWRRTT
jgi:hypothetical protein